MAWRGITALYTKSKRKRTDFWWIDKNDTKALAVAKQRAEVEFKQSPEGTTPILINPIAGFKLQFPVWVNTVEVDKTESGSMSDLWKRLTYDDEYMHEYVMTNKPLQLLRINAFKVNGKIVTIKELYGYEGRTWCVFLSEKNRNSLLVVGTKTLKEQQMAEFTRVSEKHPHSESFLPLILFESEKRFYLLNSK